jgi:hypothetical protein
MGTYKGNPIGNGGRDNRVKHHGLDQ